MSTVHASVRNAARLAYKALHTSLAPANDLEYRELLALYRADPGFAAQVQEVAAGLELIILDASERGLIVAPASRESRFAVRMADIRLGLGAEQKAALLLAHVAVAAAFFPTTDALDDDGYTPVPVSVGGCRDALHALARRLKEAAPPGADVPPELAPGWEMLAALPITVPASQRASPGSLVGVVRLALAHMERGGLVRLDRDAEEEAAMTYTATHRLRVQLRELALRRLYEIAQGTRA